MGRGPRGAVALLALAGLATLFTALIGSACVPLPRFASMSPRGGSAPVDRLAARMDPWLLAGGLADELVVEVDWVEGCEPAPLTLEGLRHILVTYGPPERPVRVERDDVIPRQEWDQVVERGGRDPVDTLVSVHAEPERGRGIEHRYVLFAPSSPERVFGRSWSRWIERDGVDTRVSGVVVFRDAHVRFAVLWISLDELERMTLIHEFGHQFGLVSDPRHERIEPRHRRHCTNLDCVMNHPTGRFWWRNLWRAVLDVWFRDYCSECRAEFRLAREEWGKRSETDLGWLASVRAIRRRDQLARRHEKSIELAARDERWDLVLRGTEACLSESPDSESCARDRVRALVELERLDEAARAAAEVRLRSDSEWADVAGIPARALVLAGRYEEALALLSKVIDSEGPVPELNPYTFEQTSFVVIDCLEALGRFGEAARLARKLAELDSPFSFISAGMAAKAADLFRRAGELDRAESILVPLHRTNHTRSWAVDALFRLRMAQGRERRARAILWAAVDGQPDERDEGGGAADLRSGKLLTRARRLALLGRIEEAEAALQTALSISETSENPWIRTVGPAEIYFALGRPEAAKEKLVESENLGPWDPCTLEWLVPFRSDPEFAVLLDRCPALDSARQ